MSYRRKSVVGDLHQFSLECEETGRELGQGSYATVMELTYKGLKCAGKNIHRVLYRQLKDDLVVRFSEECKLISELRHPNIVQFLGVHFESDNTPVLVLEYIPITLSLCLEQNGTMPEEISYSILTDVVLGLRYLHEQDPPIIHRDLSANNILLTENLTAKISDLGVAKIVNVPISCVSRLTSVPGTPCYMPPEALVPTPKYNISIDIFSYGVLIIHIFSGQWPLPTEANILDPNHPNRLIPVSEADRRLLYLDRMGESHPMVTLIRSCLNNNSMLRPKAVEIWKSMLEASADRKPSLRTKLEVLLSLMEEPDAKGGRSEIRDVGSKRTGSVRQAGSSGGKIKAAQKMTGKPNGEEMLSRLQQNTTTAAKPQLQQEVEKPWQEVEPSNEGRQTLSKTAERSRADELISKFQSKKTSPVPAEKPAANTNKSWRDGNASQQFREEKPPTAQEGLSKPWEKAAAQRQDVNGKSPKKLWGDASNEKKNWRDERGGSQKRGGPNKSWRDGPPNENSQREGLNRIWGATSQHESAPKEGLNQTEKQQRDEQAPPRKKISDNWLSKAAASSTENTVTRDRPPPQKLTHNPTNLSQHQQPSDTQAAKAVVAKKKMATALYDFQSRTSEELSISKGELIEILEEGEDTAQGQWLLAKKGPLKGSVPSTYIEMVKEEEPAPQNTWQGQGEQRTAQPAQQNTWGQNQKQTPFDGVQRRLRNEDSKTPPTSNRASIAIDKSEFSKRKKFVEGLFGIPERQEEKPAAPAWSPRQEPAAPAWSPPTNAPVCVALYPYSASDEDEVSFWKGDEAVDVTSLGEGWMEGTIVRTGEYGMLPSNYFEMK